MRSQLRHPDERDCAAAAGECRVQSHSKLHTHTHKHTNRVHSFGIQMNETVLQQLENAEFKWKGLKKKMLNRREQLTSLQQFEVCDCLYLICVIVCVCLCVSVPCVVVFADARARSGTDMQHSTLAACKDRAHLNSNKHTHFHTHFLI